MNLKTSFRKSAGFSANAKHKLLSPENIEVGSLYAFSFNPIDQPLEIYSGLNFFKQWWIRMEKLFEEFEACEIMAYCEPSRNGHFHFHGYICISHIMKFILKDLPIMMREGAIEIDTYDVESEKDGIKDYWDKYYIVKCQKFMQQFLQEQLYSEFEKDKIPEVIKMNTFQFE